MQKLRTVVNRSEKQKESEQDLRGLGRDLSTLLTPFSCLTIRYCGQIENLSPIIRHFNLQNNESKHPNTQHITYINTECMHKESCVYLFVAAIELSSRFPEIASMINLISPLQQHLENNHYSEVVIDKLISVKHLKEKHLFLTNESSLFLQQAGFDIIFSENNYISASNLRNMKQTILKNEDKDITDNRKIMGA